MKRKQKKIKNIHINPMSDSKPKIKAFEHILIDRIEINKTHDKNLKIEGNKLPAYLKADIAFFFDPQYALHGKLKQLGIHCLNDVRKYLTTDFKSATIDGSRGGEKLFSDEQSDKLITQLKKHSALFFDQQSNVLNARSILRQGQENYLALVQAKKKAPKTVKTAPLKALSSIPKDKAPLKTKPKKPSQKNDAHEIWELLNGFAADKNLSIERFSRKFELLPAIPDRILSVKNKKNTIPSLESMIKVFDFMTKDLNNLPSVYFEGARGKTLKNIINQRLETVLAKQNTIQPPVKAAPVEKKIQPTLTKFKEDAQDPFCTMIWKLVGENKKEIFNTLVSTLPETSALHRIAENYANASDISIGDIALLPKEVLGVSERHTLKAEKEMNEYGLGLGLAQEVREWLSHEGDMKYRTGGMRI